MNTKQKIGRACMIVGILLILGALDRKSVV